jgi:DNA damage-binding protein 1
LKPIVFGGLDGIITTFAVVAAVAGAGKDMKLIIMMGFANLIADGMSMGLGEYISSKAEADHVRQEMAREEWEFENYPEGEIKEMVDLHIEQGMEPEDAKALIDVFMRKKEYGKNFVKYMLVQELGMMPPDEDDSALKDGLAMFGSFLAFGSVPMWLYVIFYAADWQDAEDDMTRFAIACVVTALTMFALGAVKGVITKMGAAKAGLLMMGNGVCAAGAAFAVGAILENALAD